MALGKRTKMNRAQSAAGLIACTAALLVVGSANAATPAKKGASPQGDTYASISKLPDWSGVWVLTLETVVKAQSFNPNPNPFAAAKPNPDYPPLSPSALAAIGGMATRPPGPDGQLSLRTTNLIECLPHGMPMMMAIPGGPIGYEFLFTPGRVTILNEEGETRRIYTDGRAHTDDPDLTFSGESIGHWEGDTLVVDTTAIKPKAMLNAVVPIGADAHITERIRLENKNTLAIDYVVQAPQTLTGPWRYRIKLERTQGPVMEYVCTENNRLKNGVLDLTPPE